MIHTEFMIDRAAPFVLQGGILPSMLPLALLFGARAGMRRRGAAMIQFSEIKAVNESNKIIPPLRYSIHRRGYCVWR